MFKSKLKLFNWVLKPNKDCSRFNHLEADYPLKILETQMSSRQLQF